MSEIQELFAAAGTADQADAGIGVIWFAKHPPGDYAVTLLAYDRWDMPAVNAEWLGALFKRSVELAAEHQPAERGCHLRVEHPGLLDVLKRADAAYRDTETRTVDRSLFDIRPISKEYESSKWAATLDERMYALRPLVNSGKVIKLDTGLAGLFSRSNNLVNQIRRHRPGDASSAGELLEAFVLGVLLGTTPRGMSYFGTPTPKGTPSAGPFGPYIQGQRPR